MSASSRIRVVVAGGGLRARRSRRRIHRSHTRAIRSLAAGLRLPLTRVLRAGFGLALHDGPRTSLLATARPWRAVERRRRPIVDAHRLAGASWDTATAAARDVAAVAALDRR